MLRCPAGEPHRTPETNPRTPKQYQRKILGRVAVQDESAPARVSAARWGSPAGWRGWTTYTCLFGEVFSARDLARGRLPVEAGARHSDRVGRRRCERQRCGGVRRFL